MVYRQLPDDTDFTVFKQADYQGFNFAFIGNVGRYHTPLDNVVNADRSTIQHQGANGLAALTALANAPAWTRLRGIGFSTATRGLSSPGAPNSRYLPRCLP